LPIGRSIKWLFIGGGIVRLNRQASNAFNQGNNEDALKLLIKAERQYAFYEVTYHNLGNVFQALHRDDDAEKAFRRAIELKPTFVEAMNDLAALLVKKGDREEAEAILRKAIAIKPSYPYAHINLGRILIDKGSFSEAETEFKRALSSRDLDDKTKQDLEEEMALD
jgi:Flp pilus assembly protein TadD